jgi:hypothetical protein
LRGFEFRTWLPHPAVIEISAPIRGAEGRRDPRRHLHTLFKRIAREGVSFEAQLLITLR